MYQLSLIVDGDLTLEGFCDAVSNFIEMLHEVDSSVSGRRSIRWRLVGLRHGSPAQVICAAEPKRPRRHAEVLDAAPVVWESVITGVQRLEEGARERPRWFSDAALEAASRLARLRSRRGIHSVAITGERTDREKVARRQEITERAAATVEDLIGPKYTAPGSVEGRLQGVNSRGVWTFTIYEHLWGGRVVCILPETLRHKALELFDQRVMVTGTVSTDASGHPRHVKVATLESVPEAAALPQTLRGIDPDYTSGIESSAYVKKRWAGDA